MSCALVLLLIGLAGPWYAFDGYLRLLRLLRRLRRAEALGPARARSLESLRITVLITAHNEELQIRERIDDALASNPFGDRLAILVASDGSTDRTDEIVATHPDPRVSLFTTGENLGKTGAQNRALAECTGDLVIFSDAEARFAPDCLDRLVAPFDDSAVGLVDGQVVFLGDSGSVSEGQGFYWQYEQKVRSLESQLGIAAVASGQGCAVRRALIQPMREDVGEDCLLPLQVISAGLRVVHEERAVIYDRMPSSAAGEFRARARMTARNWRGTWAHPALLNPWVYPGIAFALWSHKLLRWLSPLFLAMAFLASLALAGRGDAWSWLLFPLAGAVALVALGAVGDRFRIRVPGAGAAYAFALANAGFATGLWQVVSGRSYRSYKNVSTDPRA